MYEDIPQSLKNKAKGEPTWERLMIDTFGNVERACIVQDKPTFFPEYTDHGPAHVAQVCEVSWRLISKQSTKENGISPADASALAISALLHDIAMHVSEEGFKSVITPGGRWRPLTGWQERPWRDIWDDYLSEARRWDDFKRAEIFGERRPGKEAVIRLPPFGEGDMCTDDRLLVGEFVRRHHPRLAHEIAVYGFPGVDGHAIPVLPTECDRATADLLGLIARSHGLPLRTAVDRLDLRHDPRHREFRHTHPVFLMSLLRVGDYLQLQKDRAPEAALLLARLLSPVSRGEWAGHGVIDEVRLGGDEDPELLFVRAFPRGVRTYAKVRSWLDGIQTELDQCWAVMGETYGRYPEKYRLGLSVRRVKSNLDDLTSFSREVDYIPEKINFTTAGGKLLKLLVGPLYGENPGVGVRELMQNSVDAVRERSELCRQRSDLPPPPNRPEGDVRIAVNLDSEGAPFSVSVADDGIGMTVETVRDFFLKAGASFRDSPEWRRNFTSEEMNASIPRVGRFGIGALAAFLIGEVIDVKTRHIEASHGITFTTRLDEDLIEIRRDDSCEIGTIITVRELKNPRAIQEWSDTKYIYNSKQWDHYCDSTPIVVRKHGTEVIPQSITIVDTPEWWKIYHDDFEAIRARWWNSNDLLAVNGIICHRNSNAFPGFAGLIKNIDMPDLAVRDTKGKMPLNLQRNGFTNDLPFHEQIVQAWLLDILARAAAWGPTENRGVSIWCGLRDGLTLTNGGLLRQLGTKVILQRTLHSESESKKNNGAFEPRVIPENSAIIQRLPRWSGVPDLDDIIGEIFDFFAHAARVRANRPFFTEDLECRAASLTFGEDWDDCGIIPDSELPEKVFDLDGLIAQQTNNTVLYEIFIREDANVSQFIADTWISLLGRPVLSWDTDERIRQLEHLNENTEFAQKVSFYSAIPIRDRPPVLDLNWFCPNLRKAAARANEDQGAAMTVARPELAPAP